MTREPFESFAQNAEDVVLWRALGEVVPQGAGRYVDVGANDPVVDSISWAFYQRGWRGVTVEPVAALAAAHRAQRPHDVQVQAVVGARDADEVVLHEIDGTGLSTLEPQIARVHAGNGWQVHERTVRARTLDGVLAEAGWDDGRDIHVLTVDTEGSEADVLQGLDLRRRRPWVLVVEATAPTSAEPTHQRWEPEVLAAGYRPCLFDGLSRFYVAQEHAEALAPALGYPACSLDSFTTRSGRALLRERDEAHAAALAAQAAADALRGQVAEVTRETVRWRTAALTRWSHAVGGAAAYSANSEVVHVRNEMAAMRNTVSWRVTAPLRAVRSQAGVLRGLR